MKKENNLINQFWSGNVTLWKSYWIVGVVLGLVAGFMLGFFGELLQAPFIIVLGLIAWQVFISVGIWRSSDKYNGPIFWQVAAKIMVVISCLYIASQLHTFL